ncbi:MAG: hypothetical protein RLZ75_2456 [Pseudomonadota bacterium]|jgi:hypothetical protein
MLSHDEVANYIASISAVIGFCSAFVAYLLYRKTVEQYDNNILYQFQFRCSKNLDDCYISLNDFVNNYHEIDETPNKRMARDKIIYFLDIIRTDMAQNESISREFMQGYDNLDLKISDITYENNFEKIIRDLGYIRNSISILKRNYSAQ